MSKHEEILAFDVANLAEKIRTKELSPIEITEAYLERIDGIDKKILAYITVTGDDARVAARKAEDEIMLGNWRGPFHGVPIALKDLCYTRAVLTTGGSKILGTFVPDFDCTVWARLREAGAILLGKLNLHEFASGATNTNPHWGTCRNPYDLDRIPGGSSGGSAAAIVAKMAAATIGTDTGGSIRIPAAFCGCIGMKQTWGRVSRFGVLPLADSLDHAGPITRTVRDAALMLQIIAGRDAHDSTSSEEPVPDYVQALNGDLKGVRVGIIKELLTGLTDEVAHAFNAALREMRILGAEVDEVSIPHIEMSSHIATNITFVEAAEYHEQWMRTRPHEYGADVRRMLEAGMMTPGIYYVRAQRSRAAILGEALEALDDFTVLAAPTAAIPAPRIDVGGRALTDGGEQVDMVTAVLRFTAPFNVTGQPALAIPTGLAPNGMPVSMQIIGKPFDEATVFQVADAYERVRGPIAEPKL
ncbi:MAG: aspartyl-tRNA(Asn)/glutamyl-tRNA(Gln) amidotransferase subunit [Candidatus Binataceae bacterium]|nr:aspartyl-tRNA(Asn)/glutamyl-tRNA(Gln) amidotransferase subunit [Candidatus Binataceae bacterium]